MCTNNYILLGLSILLICLFINKNINKGGEEKKCDCGQ